MSPEFEGILKKGCGWLPRRATFYISAVWVGCQIAGIALAAGHWVSFGKLNDHAVMMVIASPLLLGGGMFCGNVVVLGIAFARFLRPENLSFREWGIFAAVESVFALLSFVFKLQGWVAYTVTLSVWLVLTVMLGVATWFLRRWQLDQLAAEFEMLKSQNAARRVRRQMRGDPSVSLPSPEDRE